MADGLIAPGAHYQNPQAGRERVESQHMGHQRLSQPIHSERAMKIICIGAGASGLLFAYKLQRSFEKFELTVYEKNADIAGTWFENRYPGYDLRRKLD
jgi:NADPH-dependent glutamate synthase beta subunit-like oxidoreductase